MSLSGGNNENTSEQGINSFGGAFQQFYLKRMRQTMTKKKIEQTVPWQARQGDVLVEQREKALGKSAKAAMKEVSREDGGVVLAHGEVTGHKHQIRNPNVCELRNESSGERVLVVDVTGLLEHEEHVPPIEVAGGEYNVVQQCEWEWTREAARAVAD